MSLNSFAEDTDLGDPAVRIVMENFGCSLYVAQLFERGLQNVITGLERLGALSLASNITRSDSGFVNACLGRMLRVLESHDSIKLDQDTAQLLRQAHSHRNALAHRFLAEHSIDLLNPAGCAKINQKLEHMYNTLSRANAVVSMLSDLVFAQLGLDPAEVQRRIEDLRRVAKEPQIDIGDPDA